MNPAEIKAIVEKQRAYFASHATLSYEFRLEQLKKLEKAIHTFEDKIYRALDADLRKPQFEAYGSEIGYVLHEIHIAIKNLKRWMKPKRVSSNLLNFPSKAQRYYEPFGSSLIIAPWNYPFQLAFSPLVGSIAAGNTVLLKPSNISPNTSDMMEELLQATFSPEYIDVVKGGHVENTILLEQKFDIVCYTGNTTVAKVVMTAAAKNLTPVLLELGGKSPCIVDSDINIEVTAKRIAWGKFFNTGQTCVAPDYMLVHKAVKERLITAMMKAIKELYGEDPKKSPDYGRIISDKHFNRVSSYLHEGTIRVGGETDANERYIAPTIIDGIHYDHLIMQDEIFGPVMPIIEYENIDWVIDNINMRPKPRAFYVFSNNRELVEEILRKTSSGGVCVNDTIAHLTVSGLPFGGVGDSGMGNYHGEKSFTTFSHERSVLKKSFILDSGLKYAPYPKLTNFIKKLIGFVS